MDVGIHLIIDGVKAFKRYVSWGDVPPTYTTKMVGPTRLALEATYQVRAGLPMRGN